MSAIEQLAQAILDGRVHLQIEHVDPIVSYDTGLPRVMARGRTYAQVLIEPSVAAQAEVLAEMAAEADGDVNR